MTSLQPPPPVPPLPPPLPGEPLPPPLPKPTAPTPAITRPPGIGLRASRRRQEPGSPPEGRATRLLQTRHAPRCRAPENVPAGRTFKVACGNVPVAKATGTDRPRQARLSHRHRARGYPGAPRRGSALAHMARCAPRTARPRAAGPAQARRAAWRYARASEDSTAVADTSVAPPLQCGLRPRKLRTASALYRHPQPPVPRSARAGALPLHPAPCSGGPVQGGGPRRPSALRLAAFAGQCPDFGS